MSEHPAISQVDLKVFESVLKSIEEHLIARSLDPGNILPNLKQFQIVKDYEAFFIHKVTNFTGKNGSFVVFLAEKHQTLLLQKRHGTVSKQIIEIEPMLMFNLKVSVGKVFIRKETIADKILDMLTKLDIDFIEYPNFSKNYYAVAENPELARKNLPKNLLASLDKIKNMTIEINGEQGLIRPEKNLTEDLLLVMISIGYKLVS